MTKAEEVQSTAYTLLFKHGKHTILLFVEPLTTFPAILKELLTTLRERYPDGLPSGASDEPLQIPKSGIDVALGVPRDQYDIDKGWGQLDVTADGSKESPKSMGLNDGAQIAFAFTDSEQWKNDGEFHVEFSNVQDLYGEDE